MRLNSFFKLFKRFELFSLLILSIFLEFLVRSMKISLANFTGETAHTAVVLKSGIFLPCSEI